MDVLCLDKTGTLTANRMSVEAVHALGDATEDEVTAAAATLAASATSRNKTSEAIAARWPVAPGRLAGEVPFSSVRKWSAVALAAADNPPAGNAGGRQPRHRRPRRAHVPAAVPGRGHRRRGDR